MAVTGNLGLRKPASSDKILTSLDDFNANADLLDQVIGKLSELDTEAKSNLVAAINEALASAGTAGKSAYASAQDGGYTGTEAQFNAALAEVGDKANKSTTTEVTLPADGWDADAKTQTVTATGVTETANCIVTATPASFVAYGEAWVRCTAQGAGTLTFACETVPTEDLTANVLILG